MKKIYIKRFLSAVVLLCMIWQLYTLVNMTLVMKRTDGITTMQDYYVQPKGTIDVLVLGSSHAGMNIDQEVFWTNYGMSGYSAILEYLLFFKRGIEITKTEGNYS